MTCGSSSDVQVIGVDLASGGACAPRAVVDASAPAWGSVATVCAPRGESSAGCASDQVCLPAVGSPFEPTFCVLKAGSNACPSPFDARHVYYSGVSDGRGCSACGCGPPTGVDCNANAHATLWSKSSCKGDKGDEGDDNGGGPAPPPASCGGTRRRALRPPHDQPERRRLQPVGGAAQGKRQPDESDDDLLRLVRPSGGCGLS